MGVDLSAVEARSLTVRSSRIDDVAPLLPLLDPRRPLVFLRRREGIVGIGEALRMEFSGPTRMTDAASAWRRVVAAATVENDLGVAGSGLVAFGSFTFSDDSADRSVLIVPSLVIGRRAGIAWLTRIDSDLAIPERTGYGSEPAVRFREGLLGSGGYRDAVAAAVRRIRARDLRKVVLARELVGELSADADLRPALARLALGYPDCHTFSVDGIIGSSPETLVRVEGGTVSARVLAGSIGRGSDEPSDEEAAARLATSSKDLDEHQFAVQSVLGALRRHSRTLTSSDLPFALKLPNLWHLATDVEGALDDDASSLDLVAALHPTAAVAGAPTAQALTVIGELEPFDRGRYAGPVGWIGAGGDGEWAIALRAARISGSRVTAYAGAGVVVDSDPDRELAETRMKFRPIVDALT